MMHGETGDKVSRKYKALFGLSIGIAVTSAFSGDLLGSELGVNFVAGIIGNICNIAYGVILVQMEKVCRRYWRAGMTLLIGAEVMLLLDIFADTDVMEIASGVYAGMAIVALTGAVSLAATILVLYATYSEYKAHSEVMEEMGNSLSRKWMSLWAYTITGNILMLFAVITLMGYVFAFATILTIISSVMLIAVSIVRFVYLYRTMKAFQTREARD